jgi:hypothetical protein
VGVLDVLRQRLRTALGPHVAPGPDLTEDPVFPNESVVEVQYSKAQRNRAIITRDRQGAFRVHRQRWDSSDWEAGGTPCWTPGDSGATVTDTLERARVIVRETLHAGTDG